MNLYTNKLSGVVLVSGNVAVGQLHKSQPMRYPDQWLPTLQETAENVNLAGFVKLNDSVNDNTLVCSLDKKGAEYTL